MSADWSEEVRILPLFPLPIILFPGVPLPLHIFEPRYRQLLVDISAGDRTFGLSFFDSNDEGTGVLTANHMGCVAMVTEVQPLPDGRSNLMTVGVVRYHCLEYVDRGDPYLVGKVECFRDFPGDSETLSASASVSGELFMRIARAVRTISGEQTALPELPLDDPEKLSFLIAGALDVDNSTKLELFEMRSTEQRLGRLRTLLSKAVESYEERARLHLISGQNGHAGRKVEIE